MIGRPAVVQPRSLTMDERRARATRPDLWPLFQQPPAPAPFQFLGDLDHELGEFVHDEP